MSWPSSLSLSVTRDVLSLPPNTTIPFPKQAAPSCKVRVILSFTTSCFHFSSKPIWMASIEFKILPHPWPPPPRQNARFEPRRMLPGNSRLILRGGRQVHLFRAMRYISLVLRLPWFQPPTAIRWLARPHSDNARLLWFMGRSSTASPEQLTVNKFGIGYFFLLLRAMPPQRKRCSFTWQEAEWTEICSSRLYSLTVLDLIWARPSKKSKWLYVFFLSFCLEAKTLPIF